MVRCCGFWTGVDLGLYGVRGMVVFVCLLDCRLLDLVLWLIVVFIVTADFGFVGVELIVFGSCFG